MEQRHIESARKILQEHTYVTIATVCEDGTPWNSPISATHDKNLNFYWGSSELSVHSKNIARDNRVFVVVFDSHAPEGTGEGVYMSGFVTTGELDPKNNHIRSYTFTPEKFWINDVALNAQGEYEYDIRIELTKEALLQDLN